MTGKTKPASKYIRQLPRLLKGPTVAEAGAAAYEVSGWFGLFAPAGTPKDIMAKLAAAHMEAVRSSELEAKLLEQGFVPIGNISAQFAVCFDGEE